MPSHKTRFKINGRTYLTKVRPNQTLLELLREDLGLTGTKHGCELGECGACTVLIGGKPHLSCLTLASEVRSFEIGTVEGLAPDSKLHVLQQAFAETGAVQCGYCTPGMLMSGVALLQSNSNPSESEIRETLSGNICRCTGYKKIIEAVRLASLRKESIQPHSQIGESHSGQRSAPWTMDEEREHMMPKEFSVIGRPIPKVGVESKLTGQAKYTDDLSFPNMLYGKILRSTHSHAKIVSISKDRAMSLDGVRAIITAEDLPIKYGIMPTSVDERAFALRKVRYFGEPVAAVAADSPDIAQKALEYIDVKYEPLQSVNSIEEALSKNSASIHEDGECSNNIHKTVSLEFGDVEQGFKEADYTREDTFFYEGSNHVALEEHSAIASYSADGKLTVWSSTQVPHYLQRTLCKVLGLQASKVRVTVPEVGGGFGGKSDIFSHELVAAKLSMLCNQPVKITCTREEVFYLHRGRHPTLMRLKTGFKRDGRISALHLKALLDGGAYGSYGVATTYYVGALQTATYKIPNYKYEGLRVYTNKPPCGPKRGHGTPQPRFAIECQIDKVSEDLGIDPVEIRHRNLVNPFSTSVNYLRITSCGLQECIEKVLSASEFQKKRGHLGQGNGIGFAVSSYISGAGLPIYWNNMPHSSAEVRIDRDGKATVYSMATDIGQGSDSVLSFIVAEALGIDVSDVSIVSADTDLTPVDLGSYSSRVTFMAGNAALEAAKNVRELLFEVASREIGVPQSDLVSREGRIYFRDDPSKGIEWTQAVRKAESQFGALVGTGSYKPPNLAGPYKGSGVGPSPAYSFSACVAEVRCNSSTGHVEVKNVWLAHDLGRSINPLLAEGQIEGSVVMALGEALMEEHTFKDGMHKSPSMLGYKTPTSLETPEIHPIIVESIDPEGPFGAKEVGQGPLLPVVPAIANAIHDALGIRIDQVPITPNKILTALKDKQKRGMGRVGPDSFPQVEFKEALKVDPPKIFS